MKVYAGVILLTLLATGGLFTPVTDIDLNGDGLTVEEELEHGTNPLVTDTTGDGLSDYEQIRIHETDPTIDDTTGDGLTDYEETHTHETDPTQTDTRGDGISDYDAIHVYGISPTDRVTLDTIPSTIFEKDNNVYADNPLEQHTTSVTGIDSSRDGFTDSLSEESPHLDPDEIDVFVHVNQLEQTTVPITPLLNVQQAFEDAPLDTPVNLHLILDDEQIEHEDGNVTTYEYRTSMYDRSFEEGNGAYQMLFAEEVSHNGETFGGFAFHEQDGMLVGEATDQYQGLVAMHELGHSMGLYPDVYHGIDSETPVNEYPSIMNYTLVDQCAGSMNVEKCYQFSNGGEFNDWDFIANELHNHAPDMSNLGY